MKSNVADSLGTTLGHSDARALWLRIWSGLCDDRGKTHPFLYHMWTFVCVCAPRPWLKHKLQTRCSDDFAWWTHVFTSSRSWHVKTPEKRSSWCGAQMVVMMMMVAAAVKMLLLLRLWRWVGINRRAWVSRLSLSRPGGLVESRRTGQGGNFLIQTAHLDFIG